MTVAAFGEGEFNRSTQHPSLERTDCWCRSNFSIKSQDIRHRSRSFERLRRYPPILAALPALSALCLQLRHEPCPCMSLHMHAIPTWRIRVKGCCVDRLSPPRHSSRASRKMARRFRTQTGHSPQQIDALRKAYPITTSAVICPSGSPNDRDADQCWLAILITSDRAPTKMRLKAQVVSRLNQLRDTNLRPR